MADGYLGQVAEDPQSKLSGALHIEIRPFGLSRDAQHRITAAGAGRVRTADHDQHRGSLRHGTESTRSCNFVQSRVRFDIDATTVSAVLTAQRKKLILSRLAQDGQVIAKELAVEWDVSEDTIRRDLRELAAA